MNSFVRCASSSHRLHLGSDPNQGPYTPNHGDPPSNINKCPDSPSCPSSSSQNMSSQQDNTTQHILIVGAGVAGNALALFLDKAASHPLSKRKFTCTVYEAYPRSEKVYIGGGLGLAPNGVAILASLGLEKQVHERGGLAKGSTFWTEAGTQIGHWSHEGFGDYMYGMMRSTIYDIVSEELNKKGLSIAYEMRVVKAEERGDKVYVEFADGSSAQGDYLIACDGISSVETRLTLRR